MPYESELRFLRSAYQKIRLKTQVFPANSIPNESVDLGLRRQLGIKRETGWALFDFVSRMRHNTIYRLTDDFFCSYCFLLLPDRAEKTVFTLGPYLTEEPSRERILERAEALGLHPAAMSGLYSYYTVIPVFAEKESVFPLLETFGECIWGNCEAFRTVDVNQELFGGGFALQRASDPMRLGQVQESMKMMEHRYDQENELLMAVSQGLTHKAELLFSGFSELVMEMRTPDPLRNIKNYGIILNTLLRKAAEKGKVHPIYLDSVSSEYARKIEQLLSTGAAKGLMEEMVMRYCRLVNAHSSRHYTPPVQRTVTQIQANLAGDLSLKALAAAQNINASYLSALFKKETGKTVTDYVNETRTKQAMNLLNTTSLQIQTISQLCGISDVNYFSKIFKKYTGLTPKEYRTASQVQMRSKKAT